MFVEIAEELEREIFERERGTMKQFQHPSAFVELLKRRDFIVIESRVGLVHDRAQGLGRNVGREEFEKFEAQLGVAKFGPSL